MLRITCAISFAALLIPGNQAPTAQPLGDREALQERAAWSLRMHKLGYVSKAQADADQAKLDNVDELKKLQAELDKLNNQVKEIEARIKKLQSEEPKKSEPRKALPGGIDIDALKKIRGKRDPEAIKRIFKEINGKFIPELKKRKNDKQPDDKKPDEKPKLPTGPTSSEADQSSLRTLEERRPAIRGRWKVS